MSIDGTTAGMSNVAQYSMIAEFVDISFGPLTSDAFALPIPCTESLPVSCPKTGVRRETTVRWNHAGGKDCGLNNKMTSDILGAITYGPLNETTRGHDYLQVFEVDVDTGFAPMQDCNYYPGAGGNMCFGGNREPANAKAVGRSSTQYMTGPFAGQCSPNALVGSWYSFNTQGECAAGWALGFDGCSWKTRSFKLVESECLFRHCGASWRREEAPFPETVACLRQAIAACADRQGAPPSSCFSRPPPLV